MASTSSIPGAGQFLVLDDMVISSAVSKRPRTAANRKKPEGKAAVPTRSRSGCVTCRSKHAKCDETKPECNVCTSKGVKCGGYRRDLRWSTKHEKHERKERQPSKQSQPQAQTTIASHPQPPRQQQQQQQQRHQSVPGSVASSTRRSDSHPSPMSTAPSTTLPIISESVSDTGDMGADMAMDMFNQFLFGTSPTFHPNWNNQFYGATPMDNLPTASWESYSPRTLALPMPDMSFGQVGQLSPVDPISSDIVEELPDDNTNLALSPNYHQIDPFEAPFVNQGISHIPSMLIDYWFQEVCPIWSAYDSHRNLNRTMATALWHDSEAVSSCMQSMSAAFLASKIPYMKQTSISMMKTATQAIKSELSVIKRHPQVDSVPMSLLFALFCLGTTICWIDASQLGVPFLREAKALLYRMNKQKRSLNDEDHKLLKFFNKSWIYCDMLLAVVTYNDSSASVEEIDEIEDPSADDSPTADPAPSDVDEVPHPWTGISTTASRLFTQAMKLCRDFRHKIKHQKGITAHDLRLALDQIEEAKRIEEQLLRLEYETLERIGDTGDQNTPSQHLVKVGEAYRLAALLHLYQTFPDLVALRLPKSAGAPRGGEVPWDDWIIPLSLRLVKILEQLPPESGSRMVQPLLCITASTGLRLSPPAAPVQNNDVLLEQVVVSLDPPSPGSEEELDISEYISRLSRSNSLVDPMASLTEASLEVGNARHFVLKRLNILETVLPPNPIIMAKSLVKAIWEAYDDEPPGVNSVHWVDVMEKQNLRSFFG